MCTMYVPLQFDRKESYRVQIFDVLSTIIPNTVCSTNVAVVVVEDVRYYIDHCF